MTKRLKSVATALTVCGLLGSVTTAGLGQEQALPAPRVPAAPGLNDSGETVINPDNVEYEDYFEPWDFNPLSLLKDPVPYVPFGPLIPPFDPYENLGTQIKASPLLLPYGRARVSLPVVNAHVGDRFEIPVTYSDGPPVAAFALIVRYDPSVLSITGAREPESFTDPDITVNRHPDHTDIQNRVMIIQVTADRKGWPNGPMTYLQLQTLKPGESPLALDQIDFSNTDPDTIPVLGVDGMVRVSQ